VSSGFRGCRFLSDPQPPERVNSLQEMLVAFRPSEHHVDPYSHRLRTGRHQVQRSVRRLDAECQRRVWTSDCLVVIDVHVLDRLERQGAARRRTRLQLVGEVVEAATAAIEHEPAPVPLAQLASHLGQVAVTRAGRHLDVAALSQAVAGRFNELAQVERCLADWKITGQWSSR